MNNIKTNIVSINKIGIPKIGIPIIGNVKTKDTLHYIPLNGIYVSETYVTVNANYTNITGIELLASIVKGNVMNNTIGSKCDSSIYVKDNKLTCKTFDYINFSYAQIEKTNDGEKHLFKINIDNKNSIDEDSVSVSSHLYNANTIIHLFTPNLNGNPNNYNVNDKFIGNFYYCKLYDNYTNELIHHYIPVKRKSDNVVCIYDLITNEYFENSGTGILREI